MAEKDKNPIGANAQAPKPKKRRGISNETRSTDRLKFHERDAQPNGLFRGYLRNVAVEWYMDANGKQFTGNKVPRLTFTFTSNHDNEKELRYYTHSIFAIESTVDTIPGGKNAFQIDRMFQFIKHLLDVLYLKGRELTEQEEALLTLPFEDFDDNEDGIVTYKPVEVEEVINGYATLFANVAAMFNGTIGLKDGEAAKPCYKDANGHFVELWLKLLRCTYDARNKQWRNVIGSGSGSGDLGFGFVGAGLIERYVQGKAPVILRIDMARESITPKPVNQKPTIGVPNGIQLPVMNGANPAIVNPISDNNPYEMGTAGDMPF